MRPRVLALAALFFLAGCGDEPVPTSDWRAQRPEDAHAYGAGTFDRVDALLRGRTWAGPSWNERGLLELHHAGTGLAFVVLPGGAFTMGAEDATPTVAPFLLATTECTQRAWDRLGGEDDRQVEGADLPIASMTWAQMQRWLETAGLRLPSEVEWEYACRAGSRGAWCFGDDPSLLDDYAWYFRNSGDERLADDVAWDEEKVNGIWGCRAHPVAWLEGNAFGLHDMHGNVWERCSNIGRGRFEGGPVGDATTVMRGGSWYSTAEWTRSTSRHVGMHDDVGRQLGRSVARSAGAGATGAPESDVEVTDLEWGGWRSPHVGFRPAADLPE